MHSILRRKHYYFSMVIITIFSRGYFSLFEKLVNFKQWVISLFLSFSSACCYTCMQVSQFNIYEIVC